MKQLLATILFLAACSNSEPSSSRYTHQDPAFSFTLPGGWQAQPETTDATGAHHIDFRSGDGSDDLSVSWNADEWTATQARDSMIDSANELDHKVTGKGDLPGSGAWVTVDGTFGPDIHTFLAVGGQLIECDASGSAAVLDACKSLAPK